jgi:hypothetical protein
VLEQTADERCVPIHSALFSSGPRLELRVKLTNGMQGATLIQLLPLIRGIFENCRVSTGLSNLC